uniref:Retinal rod rhodopsin-sensitive cGMP 3',5'-cyclic phosphodiesterase subunit gamma n=1 Tax=Astyanax mexicanus TaxID=7994 RepID=A0A3B1J5R8_ASTMX
MTGDTEHIPPPIPVAALNVEQPKSDIKSATRVSGGPATPRKGPPKFKQRQTRQFKSKPPKKGIQGFGDDIPGMEGLGTGECDPFFFPSSSSSSSSSSSLTCGLVSSLLASSRIYS